MSITLKIYCIILNTIVWVGLFVVAFYLILLERELPLVLARIFGGSLLGYAIVWLTGFLIYQLVQRARQRKAAPRAQKDIEAASVSSCVQSSATLINIESNGRGARRT